MNKVNVFDLPEELIAIIVSINPANIRVCTYFEKFALQYIPQLIQRRLRREDRIYYNVILCKVCGFECCHDSGTCECTCGCVDKSSVQETRKLREVNEIVRAQIKAYLRTK